MYSTRFGSLFVSILGLALGAQPFSAQGALNVQVGVAPTSPTGLVSHEDAWRFHRGTNEPAADWNSNTLADEELDASWETGPGGFGFGDGDDATVLSDMLNGYSTVYIRRTFEMSSDASVRLIVDYDDGFVAYVDGLEVARSGNAGTPGVPLPYTATTLAGQNHEASSGTPSSANPPEPYEIGQLAVGTHVLAIQGLNAGLDSSDFSLIADLVTVESDPGGTLADGLFSVVEDSTVVLTGAADSEGAVRILVDGDEAAFNAVDGSWVKSVELSPGMNRLFVAALGTGGSILSSTNVDIVHQAFSTPVSGTISVDTSWNSGMGTIRVTESLEIVSGATLSIEAGTVVLISPNADLIARSGGTISAIGTEASPVFFLPADASTPWGELTAEGDDSVVALSFVEVVAGQVRLENGGTVSLEDSVLRDMHARQMMEANQGAQLTVRRCHFTRYAQIHLDYTPLLIEGCLIENISSDATDFAGANFDMVVRRNTYRYGAGGNTDAVDLDNCLGVVIEGCLIHNIEDKGISVGDDCDETVVRNNLIYNATSGISAYASDGCSFFHNTVVGCEYGLRLYDREGHPGPASGTATNNILWGNANSLSITDGSLLELGYSDVSGFEVPAGEGNIMADPLFLDEGGLDFRLGEGSPAAGTGLGGSDMGVLFPVGGIPAAPLDLVALPVSTNAIRLNWMDDSENEDGFVVSRSPDGAAWQVLASLAANSTSFEDEGLEPSAEYRYRVRATNSMGNSRLSNPAKATPLMPAAEETLIGGSITADTTWSPRMGTIIVTNNVTVEEGITLTVEPGTLIRMNPGIAIQGAGGSINVFGTPESKVVIERSAPGSDWDEIAVSGAGSSMTIRHADISGGEVSWRTDVVGLMEDTYVHHYSPPGSRIVNSLNAAILTLRRCRVAYYHETNFRITLTIIEECLFEEAVNPNSDALDFDSTPPGSTIRQTTFRNGLQSNTDAIDLGPLSGSTVGAVIEDCVMYNFTDKGISIGDFTLANGASRDVVVRNCLIFNTTIGIQVKGESDATIHNCVIVESGTGLHGFEKDNGTGGGIFTNTYNNIFSELGTVVEIESVPRPTYIVVNYSDTQGTNWPGVGNLNADPMFMDPANRDYRLRPGSPCIGTGMNGEDMGITYPIGGTPARPMDVVILSLESGQVDLTWNDVSGNEGGFVVEHSLDGELWNRVGEAGRDATGLTVAGAFNTELAHSFRLAATNFIGRSLYSDVASTILDPDDRDGDGIPNDWELAFGLDPNDASDASQDPDMDGASNIEEYLSGTDPGEAGSVLRIMSFQFVGPNQVELRFEAKSNRTYSVLYRESVDEGGWGKVADVSSEEFSRIFTTVDVPFGVTKSRYYRVVTPARP